MRVIAFDPGGTTGYCVLDQSGTVEAQGEFGYDDAGQSIAIQDLLYTYRLRSFVVIESYRIFPSALQAHQYSAVQPVQMIGRIKTLCEEYDLEYKEQPPSHKKFFTNQRLKSYGAYAKGMRHANDAARHALYYAVFTAKWLGLPKK